MSEMYRDDFDTAHAISVVV